ncbi:adenylate cyclase [Bradyrhizobium sp. USDA 4454]
MAGYSRLMAADEIGTLQELKAIRRDIVDPAIGNHKGRIVKTTGDGMLVEFASAVDAVTCAMAVQKQMDGRNETGSKIAFRIGINVGDIIVDSDDIFGDGVNVAARVENECEPGGVWLSDDAFRHVRGKTSCDFDDLGERQLKNIDRPVRLYAARSSSTPAGISVKGAAETRLLALPDKPSIAVLPFQNMSGDPEQEYFADGMVEDIITALSRFKSLFVIARNSSFTYKGRAADVKRVGRELGVRYLLEGSVRRSGARVRITGQLIEAVTGAHLWADQIDGALDDVFELQDRVTQSVVGAILPKVLQSEISLAIQKPPSTWSCYDRYLRGNSLLFTFSATALEQAKAEYQEALSLDADFAPAIASLSICFVVQQYWYGRVLDESERATALELSVRAAQLAPDDGAILSRCGLTLALLSDDLDSAKILTERALSLNPNLAFSWASLGWINNLLGDPEQACEDFDRAVRLNPLDQVMLVAQILPGISVASFLLGRQDQWQGCVNRLLALDPNNLAALLDAIDIARQQGRNDDGQKLLERVQSAYPGLSRRRLRAMYPSFRKSEHQAKMDAWFNRLPLPE